MQAGARELVALSADERRLAHDIWREGLSRRGGEALYADLSEGEGLEDLLDHLLESGCLWAFVDDRAERIAYAILRGGVIEMLFVRPQNRRQGVGQKFLRALVDHGARDGQALPGDRATKSLYESVGWKARLLTMRAE